MHELGVVFHVIRTVEEVAEENSLSEIAAVRLEIGEVSTVLEDYLQSCWSWAVKRTALLQQAELIVETVPAVTQCGDCGERYGTVAHGRICPRCGSENTYLLQGNEFQIKEIEGC